MSLPAPVLRRMAEMGLTIEQVVELAEMLAPARSSGADRQRRYRARQSEASQSDVTRDVTDGDAVPPLPSFPPRPPKSPIPACDDNTTREGQKTRRGTRLDPGWSPSPADREYAAQQGLTPQETDRAADDFRDYWGARAGREGSKLDWPATWRTRCRTIADRKRNQGVAYPSGRPKGGGSEPTDFASILARRRAEASA